MHAGKEFGFARKPRAKIQFAGARTEPHLKFNSRNPLGCRSKLNLVFGPKLSQTDALPELVSRIDFVDEATGLLPGLLPFKLNRLERNKVTVLLESLVIAIQTRRSVLLFGLFK